MLKPSDPVTRNHSQLMDGKYYDPLDFTREDVCIEQIAHQLSLKCRWNGNTNDLTQARRPIFYSVAQHSCHVHDIATNHAATFVNKINWEDLPDPGFYGLMHDAGEAYLIDVPRPLKRHMTWFNELEQHVLDTILLTLMVPATGALVECVRRIDNAMIFWERDALVGQPERPYLNELDHPGGTLFDWVPDFEPWPPSRAKYEFLRRYNLCVEHAL
jgi:uncharacterized protein